MPASTVMPDVVVEIAFTTGPNDPAPSWTDVSAYIEADSAIHISRGRSDEVDSVQPSKCNLVLDNRDGRFTPENTASPYYPNVKKGRRIRVRAMWPLAGSYADRFNGYIDAWPVQWPDETSAMSTVTVGASSRLARLGRGVELRSIVEEEYLLDTPVAYYPLGEGEGSTVAGNVSLTAQGPLTTVQQGSGGTLTFGVNTGPGTDGLGAPAFTPADTNNGKYLRNTAVDGLDTSGDTWMLIECFVNFASLSGMPTIIHMPGNAPSPLLLFAGSNGVNNVIQWLYDGINGQGTTALQINTTYHVALEFTLSGTTMTVETWLNGAAETTTPSSVTGTSMQSFTQLRVGGDSHSSLGTTMFSGTISHVAVWRGGSKLVSDARIAVHYNSGANGFSGESSNARITRLAGYADVPTAELSTETGLSTTLVNQITNDKTALALMSEVVETEGGLLFDARDGVLKFHARSHRYNTASTLTLSAASQEIEADLAPKLDDQGLVNDMTASRVGGVSVRAVDTASIDDYGLYRDSVTLLTTSDAEVADAANWKVFLGSTPQVRVPDVSVDLLNCSSAQKTALLAREIGDRITLAGLPSQAPAASMDFFIEGYEETIGAELYRMTFNLSPATLSGVWQLDSATYSVLGSTTRLGY